MRPHLRTRLHVILLIIIASQAMACAEDWKTTDGKTYQEVKVVQVEDDAVTILYKDGGARIPLATLPVDIQQRYKYDPAKAQLAAENHEAEVQESVKEIKQEKIIKQHEQTAVPQENGASISPNSANQSASGDSERTILNKQIDALLSQHAPFKVLSTSQWGNTPSEKLQIDNEDQAEQLIDKVNKLPKPVSATSPSESADLRERAVSGADIDRLCQNVHLSDQAKASEIVGASGDHRYKLYQAEGSSRTWGLYVSEALGLLRRPCTDSQNEWLHKFIHCARLAGHEDDENEYPGLVHELLAESGYSAPDNRSSNSIISGDGRLLPGQ